jgi:hypothetical protein
VAPARDVVATDNAGAMMIDRAFWSDSMRDVAFTVKPNVPASVGVPVIAPEALKLKPCGSDDPLTSVQTHEPTHPVAVNCTE